MRDANLKSVVLCGTHLDPEWFSMRYQVAEKFSLVKSPLIPGNVISMSLCGILPLRKKEINKIKIIKVINILMTNCN